MRRPCVKRTLESVPRVSAKCRVHCIEDREESQYEHIWKHESRFRCSNIYFLKKHSYCIRTHVEYWQSVSLEMRQGLWGKTFQTRRDWGKELKNHARNIGFHCVTFLQAGITKGYLEKPCLDPSETDCPLTAPNMKTGKVRMDVW